MAKTTKNKIWNVLHFWFSYYVVCGTDKTKYLRKQGVKIGNNCDILTKVGNFGSEPYLIRLGNNVTITSGVIFITHDGATRVFRNIDDRWKKETGVYGIIDIEDNVFIGMNSIILPGVHIGTNSVVGAGSVVTGTIAPNCVVAGNPAKVLCTTKEYQEKAINKMIVLESHANKQDSLERIFWKE